MEWDALMGTWGTGLYSGDIACDVRADYREMLVFHYSHEEALQRIIKDHQLSKDDPYNAAGWFALADSAWKYGHLDESLKQLVQRLYEKRLRKNCGLTPRETGKSEKRSSQTFRKNSRYRARNLQNHQCLICLGHTMSIGI